MSIDLQLYLKHLVSIGKHLTFVPLNKRISQLKFKNSETNNRHCVVRAEGGEVRRKCSTKLVLATSSPNPCRYMYQESSSVVILCAMYLYSVLYIFYSLLHIYTVQLYCVLYIQTIHTLYCIL